MPGARDHRLNARTYRYHPHKVGHHTLTADAALREHGIHDPCAFVGKYIQAHRRTGVHLTTEQWEDLEQHVAVTMCDLALDYHPTLCTSMSKYLHDLLPGRINDWYRSEFTDTRYTQMPIIVSLGADHDTASPDSDDADLTLNLEVAA